MRRPLFFLAMQSCSSMAWPTSPVGSSTMSHVSPAISPAGFGREQYNQLVAKWIAGGGGKDKEVVYLLIVKYLCLFSCHNRSGA
jgi:hypothetical protein